MTVSEMRTNYESYKAFIRKQDNGNWESHPIMEWYGRKYVVTGTIKLTPNLQRLKVIDLTAIETGKYKFQVALFSNSWPEFSPANRNNALILHADEGHDAILLEDGTDMWVHYADLPIRLTTGTKQDMATVRMAQMDELEQSIDAGGRVEL
jgi:hypothetical protein